MDAEPKKKPGEVVPFVPQLPPGAGAPSAESQPLPELFRHWWRAVGGGMASNTQKGYRRCQALAEALPDRPTIHDITGWLSALPNHAPSTIELRRAQLAAIYSWAVDLGLSNANPAARAAKLFRASQLKLPDIQGGLADLHSRRAEVLASIGDPRQRAFLAVQVYAALRPGEARGLYDTDVRTNREPWHLVIARQRPHPNSFETAPTKGKRSRVVEVRPELRAILAEVLQLPRAVLRFGTRKQERTTREVPFLCPLREGDEKGLANHLHTAYPDCFPAGRRWFQGRRTIAYEFAAADKPIAQARDVFGHKSGLTTEGYYSRAYGTPVRTGVWGDLPAPAPGQAPKSIYVSKRGGPRKDTRSVGAAKTVGVAPRSGGAQNVVQQEK